MRISTDQYKALENEVMSKSKRLSHLGIKEAKKGGKTSNESNILLKHKEAKALRTMKERLAICGIKFESEYIFKTGRKFRFDIALQKYKIAIEYEGIQAGKSRHTTLTGYTGDCNKYNIAITEGWRVLRYTVINFNNMISDLNYCGVPIPFEQVKKSAAEIKTDKLF